jgi:hypothetical protein
VNFKNSYLQCDEKKEFFIRRLEAAWGVIAPWKEIKRHKAEGSHT